MTATRAPFCRRTAYERRQRAQETLADASGRAGSAGAKVNPLAAGEVLR